MAIERFWVKQQTRAVRANFYAAEIVYVEAGVLALVWTVSCFLFSHISFLPLSVPFISYFV